MKSGEIGNKSKKLNPAVGISCCFIVAAYVRVALKLTSNCTGRTTLTSE